MSLTVELSPDMETALRHEAAAYGVEVEAFVQQMIARRLRRKPRTTPLTLEEKVELQQLDNELTAEFWERYRALQERASNNGSLSSAEHTELLSLIDQAEEWNGRRLTVLEDMAQRRAMHFPQLMRLLGIQHHPHATRS